VSFIFEFAIFALYTVLTVNHGRRIGWLAQYPWSQLLYPGSNKYSN